jgi:hypothetical protein
LGYKMGFVLCDHGVSESSGMTVHPYCWVKGDAQGPCVMPTTQYKWDIKNFWVRDTTAEEDAILDAKMIVRRDECIAVQREIAINAAETSAIYQKKKADKLVCDGTCQFSLKAQKDLRKANETIQGFQSQASKKSKIDDVATKNAEKVLGESKELKDQNKLHQQDIKEKNKEVLDLRVVLEKLQNESVFLQGQVQILQQQLQQPQYMQHQQQQQQQQPQQYMQQQQQQQQPSLQHMQMQQMQLQQMQQMQMFPVARRPVQQQLELISPTVTMNDIPTYSLQPQNIGFLPQQGVAPQFTTMYHR